MSRRRVFHTLVEDTSFMDEAERRLFDAGTSPVAIEVFHDDLITTGYGVPIYDVRRDPGPFVRSDLRFCFVRNRFAMVLVGLSPIRSVLRVSEIHVAACGFLARKEASLFPETLDPTAIARVFRPDTPLPDLAIAVRDAVLEANECEGDPFALACGLGAERPITFAYTMTAARFDAVLDALAHAFLSPGEVASAHVTLGEPRLDLHARSQVNGCAGALDLVRTLLAEIVSVYCPSGHVLSLTASVPRRSALRPTRGSLSRRLLPACSALERANALFFLQELCAEIAGFDRRAAHIIARHLEV